MAYIEITPINYPISLIQNDDWNREIYIYSDSAKTIPFDFTGWEGRAQVRKRAKDTSPVIITFDTTASTMLLSSGKVTLIADKTSTFINSGNYVWDLEFIDADGLKRTLIKSSTFTVLDDVTE